MYRRWKEKKKADDGTCWREICGGILRGRNLDVEFPKCSLRGIALLKCALYEITRADSDSSE